MRAPVKKLKLYEAMKSDIASGAYLPGAFLPNEFDLADKYGYSRDTVRSALIMLEDDKLVELLECKSKGRRICPVNVKVPLTFLLPCADFLSETFSSVHALYNRQIFKGVSQVAFEYDYRVEAVPVSPTNNAHDIDWRKLDFVNADSRIILVGEWYSDLFPLLLKRGCRVVFVNQQGVPQKQHRDFINSSYNIIINTFGAAEAMVEHLFRQGCRRIALFHPYIYISEPDSTMGGYLSGLKKCGLKFAAWHKLPGNMLTLESVKSQLKDLYKKSGGFDSLIIGPEIAMELHLHNLCHDLGLSEDIKIIVSEDTPNNQRVMPPLTSMTFPYEEIGRMAARRLLSPDFSSGEQLISARLIKRESASAFSEKANFVSL